MRLPMRRKRQRVGRGGDREVLDDLLDLGEPPTSSRREGKRRKLSSGRGKTKKGGVTVVSKDNATQHKSLGSHFQRETSFRSDLNP